jgi:hypothetical protein
LQTETHTGTQTETHTEKPPRGGLFLLRSTYYYYCFIK